MPANVFEVYPDGDSVFLELVPPAEGVVKHNILDDEGRPRTLVIHCEEGDVQTNVYYVASLELSTSEFSYIEPEIEEVVGELLHKQAIRRPFIDKKKGLLDLLVEHRYSVSPN